MMSKVIYGFLINLFIVALLAHASEVLPHESEASVKYKTKYINQIIDHFDWKSNATYKQRYLMNGKLK